MINVFLTLSTEIREDIQVITDPTGLTKVVNVYMYSRTGRLIREYEESFTVLNPGTDNASLESNSFTVTDHPVIEYNITGTVDPSVSIGDAVYIDNMGVYQSARADDIATSRVVGFMIEIISGTTAGFVTTGSLNEFTMLSPGTQYFLATDTAGGITSTAPTDPGHVVKKVGIASASDTLEVNLQTPLVVRA